MKLFSIVRAEHGVDCTGCEAQAGKAATMARVTGSRVGAYSDGTHGARVERVERAA